MGFLRLISPAIGEQGSAAIEFGLILPTLVVMSIAIVDLGQGVHREMQVQNAAQIGAQYAVRKGFDQTAITNVVKGSTGYSAIQASPAPSQFCGCASTTGISTIDCNSNCSGSTPGKYVKVSAQATYKTIIPYPLLPQSFTFNATSTVRIQ